MPPTLPVACEYIYYTHYASAFPSLPTPQERAPSLPLWTASKPEATTTRSNHTEGDNTQSLPHLRHAPLGFDYLPLLHPEPRAPRHDSNDSQHGAGNSGGASFYGQTETQIIPVLERRRLIDLWVRVFGDGHVQELA